MTESLENKTYLNAAKRERAVARAVEMESDAQSSPADPDLIAVITSWATLKKELVQHAKFKTRAQARSSIFEWIEVWYQRERSHSSLGYLSPEAFEAARRVD